MQTLPSIAEPVYACMQLLAAGTCSLNLLLLHHGGHGPPHDGMQSVLATETHRTKEQRTARHEKGEQAAGRGNMFG